MLSPRFCQSEGFRGFVPELLEIARSWGDSDSGICLTPNRTCRRLFRAQIADRWPLADPPGVLSVDEFLRGLELGAKAAPREASELFREALMEKALEECGELFPPPFPLRSGLVRRVLTFYDTLTQNHPVRPRPDPPEDDVLDRYEREAVRALEADDDVGAERLVAQTRFLAASMRRYAQTLREADHADRAGWIEWLAEARPRTPHEHIVLLGSDAANVSEIDCLAGLSELQSLTVLCHRELPPRAWVHRGAWSNASETHRTQRAGRAGEPSSAFPDWTTPSAAPKSRFGASPTLEGVFVSRDREESVARIAKTLKLRASRGNLPPLGRIAVVVPRPLPYLYLARKVFSEAGIPYRLDARFPLAAEPFAAAIDLVLEFCENDGRRESAIALFGNPFLDFDGIHGTEVAAFGTQTARYREPGGFRRWRRLYELKTRPQDQPSLPGIDGAQEDADVIRVLELLLRLERDLAPILSADTPLSSKLETLQDFLEEHGPSDGTAVETDPPEESKRSIARPGLERQDRARQAVFEVLAEWRWVVAQGLDPVVSATEFRNRMHRAIEKRTFELGDTEGDSRAIHVLDPQATGYGDFDLLFLAGLNESEWPSRSDRDVFYPQWFLRDFGWPSDHELLVRGRAELLALLSHPKREILLLRHELEDDAPTIASPFLEDAIERLIARGARRSDENPMPIVSRSEALRLGMIPFDPPPRAQSRPGILSGTLNVPEPVSATALETYLRCPFKYFSRYLLHVEEEEPVEEGLSPLERGRLIHEVLHEGFERWDESTPSKSPRPVTVDDYEEALALFRRVAIEKLPPGGRGEELHRLFGGGARAGAIEWILRRELVSDPLRQRLLEHGFQAPLQLREGPQGETPWFVQIRGRVDRADVDSRGRLHVFDYKTGRPPSPETTLQVPLYAMCLSQELGAPIDEAAYLSLRDGRAHRREDTEDASGKLREVVGAIRQGHFAPSPSHEGLCRYCGYVACCRKEIDETSTKDRSVPSPTREMR